MYIKVKHKCDRTGCTFAHMCTMICGFVKKIRGDLVIWICPLKAYKICQNGWLHPWGSECFWQIQESYGIYGPMCKVNKQLTFYTNVTRYILKNVYGYVSISNHICVLCVRSLSNLYYIKVHIKPTVFPVIVAAVFDFFFKKKVPKNH